MNNFGLGIILSFTDKASAGINGAIISLNGLNNAVNGSSDRLSTLGKSFGALSSLGAGITASITAPIAAFVGKITSYGMARASFVEDTHLAFTSLMSDAQKASDYMQLMMDFAKTTPYTYESIVSSAQTLLATGVKETDIIKKNAEGTFTGIMQAIGDAAGATGSGVQGFQAMAQALSNIKAEGHASGIRIQQLQRYGIQAQKIIGNLYNISEPEALEKIKSMDATQFIADLTKGIEEGTNGLNGATGKMAGQMANLKNTFTGAKDTFVSSLKTAGLELMGMYTDEFGVARYKFEQDMSKSLVRLADAIKKIAPIFQPIVSFVDKVAVMGSKALKALATGFSALSSPIQGILGMGLTFLALAGPGMLLLGNVIGPVIANYRELGITMSGVISKLRPFALGAGIAYLAWKTDFLGIRSVISSVAKHLKDSFGKGREIANSDIDTMTSSIAKLRANGDFWSDMTIGFAKLHVIGKALSELFHSEDGLTLSEETWQKARRLGLLPFIEGILDLKYRFDNFKNGFIEGWHSITTAVTNAFQTMGKAVRGTFLEKAIDSLGRFFKALSNNDPDSWNKVGNIAGKIAPALISMGVAMRLLGKVSTPFAKLKSLIPPIFSKADASSGAGGGAIGGLKSGIIASPKSVIKSMGNIALIIGGMSVLMLALGVISNNPYFNVYMSRGAEVITQLFASLLPLAGLAGGMGALMFGLGKLGNAKSFALGIANLAIILGGMQLLVTAMGALNSIPHFGDFLNEGGKVISTIGDALKSIMTPSFIGAIGLTALLGAVPIPIALTGLANLAILIGGFTAIISAFSALNKIQGLREFIESGGDILSSIFSVIGKVVGSIIGGVAEGVTSRLPAMGTDLAQFGENIKPFLQAFNGVDASGIASFASAFGKMMLTLTGNNILEFFGGKVDLAQVGNDLSSFGESIQPFLNSMANVSDASITNGTNVLQMLSNISGYQLKTGGLLQKLTGEVDLSTIGQQLNDFAINIKPFLMSASSIPEGSTENATKVLELLGALSGYQLKTGGLAQLFTGGVDLSNAGTQLTNFATSVQPFLAVASTIPENSVENGRKMLRVLDVLSEVNAVGTVPPNIASVGTSLSSFATSVKPFFTTASSIGDFSGGKNLLSAVSKARELNSIASSGGSNLVAYANGLVQFSQRWKTFNSGMTVANTSGVTAMGNALQNFNNKLSSVNSNMQSKLQTMVNTAKTQLTHLANAFANTKLKLPKTHIAVPHFSMSGSFNAKSGSVPSVSVSWYQTGAVFDKPSIIGVGENGREAVMPLEKNTGWITELATKIGALIDNSRIPNAFSYLASKVQSAVSATPNVVSGTPINNVTENKILTPTPITGGNSQTIKNSSGNTNIDNSVTFASGSIIVNVQNASEEEAERLANSIMDKISWKQKLETMRNFADLGAEVPVFDI